MESYVIKLAELGKNDVETVGGKNASLGEMISNLSDLGVTVPGGFATTAAAYREFLKSDDLDRRINDVLGDLDVNDIDALTAAGEQIRHWILETALPQKLMDDIVAAWSEMSGGEDITVAVRSSATAEDLPEASFAGQQETFLNIRGVENVIEAMHQVFASLFNDRAIASRVHQGFDHSLVALSAGIQTMVHRMYRVTPVVLVASDAGIEGQGRIFLGMDGLEPLYGEPKAQLGLIREVAQRILPDVFTHAEMRLGWGIGKFTAWVAAATAHPDRPIMVEERDTLRFLASRPVTVLPAPTAVIERLQRLGLTSLGDVAALPESALVSQFGRIGRLVWRWAAGRRLQPVKASARDEPIAIMLEFPEPVGQFDMLCHAIEQLVTRTLSSPRRRGRSIKAVRLTARLEHGGSWGGDVTLKEATATVSDIRRPLCHRLSITPVNGAVQHLLLTVTAFGPRTTQEQLFHRDASSAARAGRADSLRAVVDELRTRNTKLFHVMEVMPWSRIPERRHALIDYDP